MFWSPTQNRAVRAVVVVLAAALAAAGCGPGGEGGSAGPKASRKVISNIGSDTMVHLAMSWAEEYAKVEPDVSVEVTGGGSGQGVAALLNGSCDLANCSRTFEEREVADLKAKRNLDPKEHLVAYDALSVFVHKSNPIDEISLEQLAELYAAEGKVTRWSQLGVTMPGAKGDEVILIGRQNNSGTYVYFKEAVVGRKREFRLGSLDMNGSKEVAELIARTPNAIGYTGMGYATPDVKVLRVASKTGERAVAPSIATTLDKSYPIARPLYMYTAGEPPEHVQRYLAWVVSDAGEAIVRATGYVPIPKK